MNKINDDLKNWLINNGYRIYDNYVDAHNYIRWYACKLTESKRLCSCNDAPAQIVVTPFATLIHGNMYESVTVDIAAEHEGTWWKLQAYSLSPEELMNKLGEIEERLVRAWEAL